MPHCGTAFFITGLIDSELLSDFVSFIKKVPDDASLITVVIQSPGGKVPVSFAISNIINSLPCKVRTVNIGNVDSAANIVFAAGHERISAENGIFYFHGVLKELNGSFNAADLRRFISEMETERKRMTHYFYERTGKPEAVWRKLMGKGTDLGAKEALKLNLATRICGDGEIQNILKDGYYAADSKQ